MIENCVLDEFDAGVLTFEAPVTLDGVEVLGACLLHSCFFLAGFTAVRCRFRSGVDFAWGGHNKDGSLFCLEDSEFDGFADFNDDWFEGPVKIRGCAFRGGANLQGLKGQPNHVTFDVEPIIESNTGRLDFDVAPPRAAVSEGNKLRHAARTE